MHTFLFQLHYLFGGNPGRPKDPKLRLNDFWRLRLMRPSQEDLLRQCKLLLRRQRFEELAVLDPLNGLVYLQTCLSELIDHSDPNQTKEVKVINVPDVVELEILKMRKTTLCL